MLYNIMNKCMLISIFVIPLMLYSAKIEELFQNNACTHKIYFDCPVNGKIMYAELLSKNVSIINDVKNSSHKISAKK